MCLNSGYNPASLDDVWCVCDGVLRWTDEDEVAIETGLQMRKASARSWYLSCRTYAAVGADGRQSSSSSSGKAVAEARFCLFVSLMVCSPEPKPPKGLKVAFAVVEAPFAVTPAKMAPGTSRAFSPSTSSFGLRPPALSPGRKRPSRLCILDLCFLKGLATASAESTESRSAKFGFSFGVPAVAVAEFGVLVPPEGESADT